MLTDIIYIVVIIARVVCGKAEEASGEVWPLFGFTTIIIIVSYHYVHQIDCSV
jgi:hypothetical protein